MSLSNGSIGSYLRSRFALASGGAPTRAGPTPRELALRVPGNQPPPPTPSNAKAKARSLGGQTLLGGG